MDQNQEIQRLRDDVNALVLINANLLDALKYVIRHGSDGAEQAETKRSAAERRFHKRFLIPHGES